MYILWPRRTKHQRLPVWTNLRHNLANLRLEPHVQHPIRLVHNEISDTAEVRLLRLQHVNEAAGRRDDDLDTTLQIPDLWALWRTAVDGSVADAGV